MSLVSLSLIELFSVEPDILNKLDLTTININDFLRNGSIFDGINDFNDYIPDNELDQLNNYYKRKVISREFSNIAIVAYLFQCNYGLISFLDRLIRSTTIIPTDAEVQSLYNTLIYLDYSKTLKLSFEKFNRLDVLCFNVVLDWTTSNDFEGYDLNYLELSWVINSYKCFKLLKNIFRTTYQNDYDTFINRLIVYNEDYEYEYISLNISLKEVARLKKWKGRKIYSNFIKNDLLKILDNSDVKVSESNLNLISEYAIFTYSYGVLDIIFDYYLNERRLNERNNVVYTIIDTILINHCPKLWVKLLNKIKTGNVNYDYWKLLVDKLIEKYFSIFSDDSANSGIDQNIYWGSPKDRRYSYIVYFDKLFKVIGSDEINKKLLDDTYTHFSDGSTLTIKLDEFLVSFPNNLNLLKKLKIDWNIPNKPYLINAYRYSDNKTIKWLLYKIKFYNLIFEQNLIVLSHHRCDSISIKFNPFLASLCNPNINVLKELINDYNSGIFEKYPDGFAGWFDNPLDYISVLFKNKHATLKYSINKLILIKDILKVNSTFNNDTDISHFVSSYLLLLTKSLSMNLELAKKGVDIIMYISNKNNNANFYHKHITNYPHGCYTIDAKAKILDKRYFIMEIFLDHPSKFYLTIDQQNDILKYLILSPQMSYNVSEICSRTNENYLKLFKLLPFEKRKIRIDRINTYLCGRLQDYYSHRKCNFYSFGQDKNAYLERYNISSRQTSLCSLCNRDEYDCFLEKCQILEEIFQIDWNDYKNDFTYDLNRISNRKIVRYLLFKNINISFNIVARHQPYFPDLISWSSMLFTFHRCIIRKRIMYLKKHRENMYKTLQDIVYHPPIDDHLKEKYPVLANGSRMYQFAMANFYLNTAGGDELEDDQDELIYTTYQKYKALDYAKKNKLK